MHGGLTGHDDLPDAREAWQALRLPDVIGPELKLLFVGINPGKRSAEIGHHFGGHTNLFWRLLADAGFTPRLFRAEEDVKLPEYGIGITNLAARPTRSAGELSASELAEGGNELRRKLARLRPRAVAFLGKAPYAYFAGMRPERVEWGPQAVSTPYIYVAPNPSTRSTIPYEERLRHFRALRAAVFGEERGRL